MQAGGHFSSGSRYGTDGIVAFAANIYWQAWCVRTSFH